MESLEKNRRAQSFSPVKTLILCLVAGILLIAAGYKIVQTSEAVSNHEKCRLSIFAATKAAQFSKGALELNLECPADQVTIKKGGVLAGGRVQEDKVKDLLLREMFDCYRKTGSGKMDPFKSGAFDQDDTYCLTCANIRFDKKMVELANQQGVAVTGLPYYMETRKIPGQKVTLFQATHGGGSPPAQEVNILKQQENDPRSTIYMDQDYVTVWRFEKYEEGLVGKAIALAAYVAIGTAAIAGAPILALANPYVLIYLYREAIGGVGPQGKTQDANALGILVRRIPSGDNQIDEQVWLLPEERLSGKAPGSEKDFCTVLLN
ncbi:hypothetical protein HY772_06480 [Candidatus Woesearchaeota archaeon]|nr:hypothetical protein [Candidatus Woesearchaeota archaeon]